MKSEDARLDFIDALRGYAILAVIAVHCWIGLHAKDLPKLIEVIFINGGYGVQLFFIVSAFTLFYTITYVHNSEKGWLDFFIRRVFRILPMYYVALVLYIILISISPIHIIGTSPSDVNTDNIITHATLFFPFDTVNLNTLVPGGWSVAAELLFYISLPLIFMFIKKTLHAAILVISSAIGNLLFEMYLYGTEFGKANLSYLAFWYPNQFTVFCLGILLFFLIKELILDKQNGDLIYNIKKQYVAITLLIASIGVATYALFVMPLNNIMFLYFISIALMIFALSTAIYPHKPIVNKYIQYIGRISYSCYFIHFAIVTVICECVLTMFSEVTVPVLFGTLILSILVTIPFAHMTYTYIEQPGINLGKQLVKTIHR
jgi:peptidoglycan/LPS O-acetylase OafA/YrhL